MAKDSFDAYKPWNPQRREVVPGDDSYFEENDVNDDDALIMIHEITSSRIVALAAAITAIKDIPEFRKELNLLVGETMKLAVESKEESVPDDVDTDTKSEAES